MSSSENPALYGWGKILLSWVGTLGTIGLAQWHVVVGILVGLAVLIFTCLQIYVLWRDKIVRWRPSNKFSRSTDTTAPAGLGD